MPEAFTEAESRQLGQDLASGQTLSCPHCAVALDRRDVPPRREVSYVRDRVWLTCPKCHRTVVLDRRDPR